MAIIRLQKFDECYHEASIIFDGPLDTAIGYLCAIAPMELSRRNVKHSMTHWSFKTKSFACSAPNGGMFRLTMD